MNFRLRISIDGTALCVTGPCDLKRLRFAAMAPSLCFQGAGVFRTRHKLHEPLLLGKHNLAYPPLIVAVCRTLSSKGTAEVFPYAHLRSDARCDVGIFINGLLTTAAPTHPSGPQLRTKGNLENLLTGRDAAEDRVVEVLPKACLPLK